MLLKLVSAGSTHTTTPRQFIDDLKVLELGGVGSKAIPNGLRDPRGGQRPYQEYYDEKYSTEDAPPPRRPAPAPAPQEDRSRLLRPSAPPAAPSYSGSSMSTTSNMSAGAKEEKKKKKGLFRF